MKTFVTAFALLAVVFGDLGILFYEFKRNNINNWFIILQMVHKV